MSLEEKFAKLTVDDAPVVVETVKSEGVEKSGLAANASVLAARCASSDDAEAIAALKTVQALAEGVPVVQIFTKECLAACKSPVFRSVVHFNVEDCAVESYWGVGMGKSLYKLDFQRNSTSNNNPGADSAIESLSTVKSHLLCPLL